MRHSIQAPRSARSSCVNPSGIPQATRICHFTKIDAVKQFCNAVLNLQTQIHFHEPEMSALVEQKFQRAESDVADGFDSSADVFDEGVAHFRGDSWRRRFFDELLMAQLHRTIALAEADDVAIFIGEDLKFHVARRIHTFFQIERTVAKSRAALRFRCRKNLLQLLWRSDHANAATPPPERALSMTG